MPDGRMRLDELARKAGVATTTVRLYQNRGLLPHPELIGRTGYYGESHLARLRLIARLQQQGFSLAGIGRLLSTLQAGGDLAGLVGLEQGLDDLLSPREPIVLDLGGVQERLRGVELTPELLRRAAGLGLLELTDDGRIRIPDERFLDTGAALAEMGIPADVLLDEWEWLAGMTDAIAGRFIALFEDRILPVGWRDGIDAEQARQLAGALARLSDTANSVVAASLAASIRRLGGRRLGDVLPAREDD